MSHASAPTPLPRRRLLLGLVAAALPAAPAPVRALAPAAPERALLLHHRHTGERRRAVYFADGRYRADGLAEISHLLRDWRTGEVKPVDPRLLDIVHLLQRQLRLDGPLEVICGYRSPATNAMLRRTTPGVARHSLHMDGKAVDLAFEGHGLEAVQRAAVALGAGGVGYYPASGFVHLDSGPPRVWQDGGGRGSRRARARAARLRAARMARGQA